MVNGQAPECRETSIRNTDRCCCDVCGFTQAEYLRTWPRLSICEVLLRTSHAAQRVTEN